MARDVLALTGTHKDLLTLTVYAMPEPRVQQTCPVEQGKPLGKCLVNMGGLQYFSGLCCTDTKMAQTDTQEV